MTIHPFQRPNRTSDRAEPCTRRQPQPFDHAAWVAAEEELLQDLEEMLDQDQPFAFLDFAARSVTETGPCLGDYLATLRRSGLYEAAMLATSMDWLASGVRPDSVLDPDTPAWLVQLDRALVVGAHVRQEVTGSTSFLIGLELVGGHTGTLHARIDASGEGVLTNYFVTDDSVDALARVLAAVGPQPDSEYLPADIQTTVRAVSSATERYDTQPLAQEPGNPWPKKRRLLDFALRQFGLAGTELSE